MGRPFKLTDHQEARGDQAPKARRDPCRHRPLLQRKPGDDFPARSLTTRPPHRLDLVSGAAKKRRSRQGFNAMSWRSWLFPNSAEAGRPIKKAALISLLFAGALTPSATARAQETCPPPHDDYRRPVPVWGGFGYQVNALQHPRAGERTLWFPDRR
jgi:hypothetical protein